MFGKKLHEKMKGAASPTWIIMVFIVMLIGVVLLGPFADQVSLASGGNVTGAAKTITDLLPLFFAIIILLIAVRKLGK